MFRTKIELSSVKSQQYLFIVHIGGEGQRGGHSGFLTNGFRELEMT